MAIRVLLAIATLVILALLILLIKWRISIMAERYQSRPPAVSHPPRAS